MKKIILTFLLFSNAIWLTAQSNFNSLLEEVRYLESLLPNTFPLAISSNNNPTGMTYHDGLFYITDGVKHLVFVYREDGTLVRTFNLHSNNRWSTSITYYSNRLYILDATGYLSWAVTTQDVYYYDTNGSYQGMFSLDSNRTRSPLAMTYHNGRFYFANRFSNNRRTADSYTLDGQYIGTSDLETNCVDLAGMTADDSGHIFTVGGLANINGDQRLCYYTVNNASSNALFYSNNIVLQVATDDILGLAYNDGKIYCLDRGAARVYSIDSPFGNPQDSEAPTITANQSTNISNSLSIGSLVLVVSASDDVGVAGFEVVSENGGNSRTFTIDGDGSVYTATNLSNNFTYTLSIRARDYIGNTSQKNVVINTL